MSIVLCSLSSNSTHSTSNRSCQFDGRGEESFLKENLQSLIFRCFGETKSDGRSWIDFLLRQTNRPPVILNSSWVELGGYILPVLFNVKLKNYFS